MWGNFYGGLLPLFITTIATTSQNQNGNDEHENVCV